MHRFALSIVLIVVILGGKAALAQRWEEWPDTVGRIQSSTGSQGDSQFYMWRTIEDYKQYKELRKAYDEAVKNFDLGKEIVDSTPDPDATKENGDPTPRKLFDDAKVSRDAALKDLESFRTTHHVLTVNAKTSAFRTARTDINDVSLYKVVLLSSADKGSEGWVEQFDSDMFPDVGETAYIRSFGTQGAFDAYTLRMYREAKDNGDEATWRGLLRLGRVLEIGIARRVVVLEEDNSEKTTLARCMLPLSDGRELKLWVPAYALSVMPPRYYPPTKKTTTRKASTRKASTRKKAKH